MRLNGFKQTHTFCVTDYCQIHEARRSFDIYDILYFAISYDLGLHVFVPQHKLTSELFTKYK